MASNNKRLGPAVVNGVPLYTSPSALQKFNTCQRQWFYRYVLRLPDKPPSKGQQRGKEGHARIEHFLRTGQDVLDPLETVGRVTGHIPVPGVGLLVEQAMGGAFPLVVDGLPLIGRIDVVNLRAAETGLVEVTDWKFKRDLGQYGATAAELCDPAADAGIQMVSYAEWVRRYTNARRIRLRHVTFQTQGRRNVEEVATEVAAPTVPELFRHVEDLVTRLRVVAASPDVSRASW